MNNNIYVYDPNLVRGGRCALPVKEYAELAFGDPQDRAMLRTVVKAFAQGLRGVTLTPSDAPLGSFAGPLFAYEDETGTLHALQAALAATPTGSRAALPKSLCETLHTQVGVADVVLASLRRAAPAAVVANGGAPSGDGPSGGGPSGDGPSGGGPSGGAPHGTYERSDTVDIIERDADGDEVEMRYTERVSSSTAGPSLTVTGRDETAEAGTICVVTFVLATASSDTTFRVLGDAAFTWPRGAVDLHQYSLEGQPCASLDDLNALLARMVRQSVTVSVQFGAPAGSAGEFVAVRLSAVAYGVSGDRAGPATGTALVVLAGGGPETALAELAKTMYADRKKKLSEPQARAVLKRFENAVAAVVNHTGPINVDSPLFAVALALGELAEDRIDTMIAQIRTRSADDDAAVAVVP